MTGKVITIPQLTDEMLAYARHRDEESFLTKVGAETVLQAFERFESLEQEARSSLGICRRELQRAILNLYEIREKDLWIFSGQKSWTQYLNEWCTDEKISASGIKAYLAGVRVWTGGLGRSLDELAHIEDGVGVARKLIDKSESRDPPIGSYNSATGKIESLNPKWVPLLPPAEEPAEMVNSLVDAEVTEESTGETFLYAMRLRLMEGKEQSDSASQTDAGRLTVRPYTQGTGEDKALIGFVWELMQNGKIVAKGTEVFKNGSINKYHRARALLVQMWGHSWNGG